MCMAQSQNPEVMEILLLCVGILVMVLMTRGLAGSHTLHSSMWSATTILCKLYTWGRLG